MDFSAVRAGPFSYFQVFCFLVLDSAATTKLATQEESVHLDQYWASLRWKSVILFSILLCWRARFNFALFLFLEPFFFFDRFLFSLAINLASCAKKRGLCTSLLSLAVRNVFKPKSKPTALLALHDGYAIVTVKAVACLLESEGTVVSSSSIFWRRPQL